MLKNKTKDNNVITYRIKQQKIKNIIHLDDLKKFKKYSISGASTTSNNYILQKTKMIMKKLAKNYNRDDKYYYNKVISDIIDNEPSHFVASFKEYLIFGDYSEFLQAYFNKKDLIKLLPLIFEYYHKATVIFPNYVTLTEKKYLYKNIRKKQQIINIQQEQEEIDKRIKNKKLEKKLKLDFLNYESDSNSKTDIFTSHALNSILNQTNTSNNLRLFGISKNKESKDEIFQFIEKIKNEERKISLKNKNQKNRNKHMIAIHKGMLKKKENNKSNNTNTYNTISTKNNTKGKEKSNVDKNNFSDKNINTNYNLSIININNSKTINKLFLLKLDKIKKKKEEKSLTNNILFEPSLNTTRKLIKNNYFSKKKNTIISECNKIKLSKMRKKIDQKKFRKIQNYMNKPIERIKSCYGMKQTNSRNRNVFSESSLISNHSNKSNKNNSKKVKSNFKICSTLNSLYNESHLLSIDIDKRNKHLVTKKPRNILDSKIINIIFSKRLAFNFSSKNCLNNSKKYLKSKFNKIKNTIPEKKVNSIKKQKNMKTKNIFSLCSPKMPNPFEVKISPPHTNRNPKKNIFKYVLLSPSNINSQCNTSRLVHKKQLSKNDKLNNQKIKFKKDFKKILKGNTSKKMINRKTILEGRQTNNKDFLTINVAKKYHKSPNPIDMKKSIEKRNITHSVNNKHHRTKTLYNKIPIFYIKSQK